MDRAFLAESNEIFHSVVHRHLVGSITSMQGGDSVWEKLEFQWDL